jgi:hypothetical protein
MKRTRRGVWIAVAALAACRSQPSIESVAAEIAAADAASTRMLGARHAGPPVPAGKTGPARFVPSLFERFDEARALEVAAFADRFYRAPANDGYEATLDHVAERLRSAGFGAREGFELEFITTARTASAGASGERAPIPAWTPLSASVALVGSDGERRVLHAFDEPGDMDRTMLPVNAPSANVTGRAAFSLDELDAGEILLIDAEPLRRVLASAERMGAAAVISSYLAPFNVDPTGRFRHLDAVQYRTLAAGTKIPVAMISPRAFESAQKALDADPAAQIELVANARFDARPLRTLCARIAGSDRAQEAVAVVSHVQEPGACDNASGVAGLCESACNLAELIASGALERPSRSIVFLWGDEYRQSSAWLGSTALTPVAGLSSDMTGESREKTGAITLLERMPDPGAIEALAPDHHTPWGKTEVDEGELRPNGLALIARCALLDVADIAEGWETAEHPFEGGSDHEEFIQRGVPAALFWHFTDFAYHTSLDRMEHVDASEMRRTGVALMAAALALADPEPADLDRYLRALNEEENLRVAAATSANQAEIADKWRAWCDGARQWLREQCLRIPESERTGGRR